MPKSLSLLNLFDILAEAIAIALMASEGIIVFIFISISTQAIMSTKQLSKQEGLLPRVLILATRGFVLLEYPPAR